MTVNAYLNTAITNHPDFISDQQNDSFLGERICKDGGMYFMLNELDELPAEAAPFVDRVTGIDHLSTKQSRREIGIYHHNSAEMQVEIQNADQKGENYLMFIKGKTYTDVRELARLFKTGKIHPDESFEGGHQGKSRVELEAEVARLREEVSRADGKHALMYTQLQLSSRAEGALEIAQDQVKAVQRITAGLVEKRWQWPFIRKTTIATKIDLAINGL